MTPPDVSRRTLPAPRGLLFDLDDTIIDHAGAERTCLETVCAEAKARFPEITEGALSAAIRRQTRRYYSDPRWVQAVTQGRSDVRTVARAVFRASFLEFGIDSPDLASAFADEYRDLREARMHLVPGAIEMIDTFRRWGIRLALVTNGNAARQRTKIDRFDLAPHFDFVLVEGEFGTGKPDVRVYEAALGAIDRLPRETWMIGDDLHLDVAAPQRLGITGIWVDAWGTGLTDDAPSKPDLVIRSIAELPRHLHTMLK